MLVDIALSILVVPILALFVFYLLFNLKPLLAKFKKSVALTFIAVILFIISRASQD